MKPQKKKTELWQLTPIEYNILSILASQKLAMNAGEIQKELATNAYAKLDRENPGDAILDNLEILLSDGTAKSMREAEKLLRKHIDFPTPERIVRLLKRLGDEGLVVSRNAGEKSIYWALTPEVRRDLLNEKKLKEKLG